MSHPTKPTELASMPSELEFEEERALCRTSRRVAHSSLLCDNSARSSRRQTSAHLGSTGAMPGSTTETQRAQRPEEEDGEHEFGESSGCAWTVERTAVARKMPVFSPTTCSPYSARPALRWCRTGNARHRTGRSGANTTLPGARASDPGESSNAVSPASDGTPSAVKVTGPMLSRRASSPGVFSVRLRTSPHQ